MTIPDDNTINHSRTTTATDAGDLDINEADQKRRETDSVERDCSRYTLKWRPWRLNITDFSIILAEQYRGSGTEDDPYLVTWLSKDPENPKTYSNLLRWNVTSLISWITLSVALASSAYSGGIEHIMIQYHSSEEVAILGLSLMVLGYALGPLLWGPMSEVYGRRNVFCISICFYTIWTCITSAAQNMATIIVFRFMAGLFGSSALVIPGGQIADLFPIETRGLGIGAFCAAPFLGPALGPLIGGYLGDSAGWRWIFGFLGLYAAIITLLGILTMPETYAPLLLRQRAARLSQATGRRYMSLIDAEKPLIPRVLVQTALMRPWVLLFSEPIVLILTIYMSCVYGTLYMSFAAFPIIFQQGRGWSAGKGGLAFMGILVGFIIGVIIVVFENARFVRILKRTRGHPPPECRLPASILGGGFIVLGLAWIAATDGPGIHWAAPIVGGVPFATGLVLVFVCLGNYLVDAYVVYAASVIAANGVVRSLFGAAFPLFTTYMFQNIGIHWGVAVPGFIALGCFPFPIIFYRYGPQLRKRCKYAAEAARVLEMMKPTCGEHEEASGAVESNESSNESKV